MPNWCSNELRITPVDDSQEAMKAMGAFITIVNNAAKENSEAEWAGLFQQTLPMPAILEGISAPPPSDPTSEQKTRIDQAIAETGHSNWYDWHCEKWGTKWDACELQVNEADEDSIDVYFETAWSPPEAWLVAMREKHPLLDFWLFFREDGVEAAGYL
ncbi:hypothetical protein [Mesorhizobium sp. B2-3-10]|uniref:DUF1281 family ferredoxin-like fold protein n=1 Tax=Mesorhizobium sp. B2-3-10 TaxID=2589954 RepID=UPI00112DB900|nr:hypothetical protein [Mesorhizobium sp. B2-3-10]TPL94757.1 hypothetical protein FJ943_25060 [Mesorhizobium sp. B2-3-10]